MDTGQWASRLQQTDTLKIGNKQLLVIHDVNDLNRQAPFDKCHVVIYGHTHRPQVEKQQGILFVNPGSAVQPRYGYPPSVAVLEIKAGIIKARLIDLTR